MFVSGSGPSFGADGVGGWVGVTADALLVMKYDYDNDYHEEGW